MLLQIGLLALGFRFRGADDSGQGYYFLQRTRITAVLPCQIVKNCDIPRRGFRRSRRKKGDLGIAYRELAAGG